MRFKILKSRFIKTWRKLEKVFGIIFLIHALLFLFFIDSKFNVDGFVVQDLRTKVLFVLLVIFAGWALYYFVLRKIKFFHKLGVICKDVFFACYISSFLYLLLGSLINPPITLTQAGSIVQGYGLHRDYISYKNMGAPIKLAVMASEDQLFADHDGFDIKAIARAVKYNQRHTQKQRGASTISQQTAKNIFLWQGGGFLRKGLEVFFTYSIEHIWAKRIILCRYLNIAEMGPGIFGVQAAAKKYFNKNASELSRQEAAMIAACLPNPKKYSVVPLSKYVAARSQMILRQMRNLETDPDILAIIQ